MKTNPRPWFIPPIWLTIVMLLTGVIGTDFVFHAFTNGAWLFGLFGLILLMLSLFVLGVPLAYARYLSKQMKVRK